MEVRLRDTAASVSRRQTAISADPAARVSTRPRVEGKFIWHGGEKLFVRGVTYGAFAPNSRGDQFPEPLRVADDLALMRAANINTILTYTVPPLSMLDQAHENGLRVIVNIPWMGHVCFLDDPRLARDARNEVRRGVAACRAHPAVLMYAVAKELPPQIIRWHGKRPTEAFLEDLYHVAKEEDPEGLVTYTNFPTTEYLELPFLDVSTFNVYLHERHAFSSYLARLQHRAGERPFVLTELGMCSFRHGDATQAEFIDWQVEETFAHGAAGAVIFSWTDPFFQDGCLVDEWGFGLVDAERRPKPSFEVASRRFGAEVPFPEARDWPQISVVVALHNAEGTLDECLASLGRLNYPDYEVIVVDDGSTDGSSEIIRRYPYAAITTPNEGVSAARNQGLRAATGKIVAYIDSDAAADPDWLSYLATTFMGSDFVGVGGPNLVPKEDNWVAKCIFRSPGGPTHVMLDDVSAEHIPGCNMAFYRSGLEEIGGFDPLFTAAGDDVDICWRLLEKGHRIGFSPAAMVWHHRRPSTRGYWRQQVGYGKAEALLERRHPNKFNPWGHTFWGGRIYSPYPTFRLLGEPVIYQGLWGSAPFQSIYDPDGGGAWAFLPRALEFHVGLVAVALGSIFFPWALFAVVAGLGYIVVYCAVCAADANLDVLTGPARRATWAQRLRWRAMIAYLHFLEPVARDWGRLLGGLTPWRSMMTERRARHVTPGWRRWLPFGRVARWSYDGDMALEKNEFLTRMTRRLNARFASVGWNSAFQDWDLRLRRGSLGEAELRMAIEHHGGPRRSARFAVRIRSPRAVKWVQGVLAGVVVVTAAISLPISSAVFGGLLAALTIGTIVECNRLELGILAVADEVERELAADPHSPAAAV
jgi:GT2 family glycosyltransferase